MIKEHKEKINHAIDFCETHFRAFIESYSKFVNNKKEAIAFESFLLENTYFAGGVFRSIFTNSAVNDIDLFFRNEDALDEFLFKATKQFRFFDKVTTNGSFGKDKLSFITSQSGNPDDVTGNFDFSFNRHYFVLNSYKMCFEVDTFNKLGYVTNLSNPEKIYKRYIRFLEEGFILNTSTHRQILDNLMNTPLKPLVLHDVSSGGYGQKRNKADTELTGCKYYEDDYFSVGRRNKYDVPPAWGAVHETTGHARLVDMEYTVQIDDQLEEIRFHEHIPLLNTPPTIAARNAVVEEELDELFDQ